MRVLVPAVLALLAAAGQARAGCGADPAPCTIPTGSYHAELPDAPDGTALLFLHGWTGTGEGTMSNRGMVDAFLARGVTVIAPDGQKRPDGPGRAWDFMPGRDVTRDEVAFLRAVADDAAARFGLDRQAMVLGGFSIGGSMTSYVACNDPGAFMAYVPVAGSFWRPHPAACKGPVRLLHTHGWTDTTVPLEGRRVGGAGATQGDVFAAMDIWRAANGCTGLRPDAFGTAGALMWRRWTACAAGSALTFALHPGAHGVPPGWADMALTWIEGL